MMCWECLGLARLAIATVLFASLIEQTFDRKHYTNGSITLTTQYMMNPAKTHSRILRKHDDFLHEKKVLQSLILLVLSHFIYQLALIFIPHNAIVCLVNQDVLEPINQCVQ